jgi:4-amino-4-deoxychorismate lyase
VTAASRGRGESPDALVLNGRELSAHAPPDAALDWIALLTDRGLHYGDGLFETIACVGGRPRFLAEHLERLAGGCARLAIRFAAFEALRGEVTRLAAASERAIIKVLVTRGPATARGYAARGDESATRLLLRYEWPAEDPRRESEGVAVGISGFALAESPRLAGLKHLNRLEQILARTDLQGAGLEEALLLSRSGCLISGTMSNVFLVLAGRLATPQLDRCGVAGVMRRVVMRIAAEAGLAVEERRLTRPDLDAAEELFLTNARIGIWPVRAVASRALAPGPLTRRLQGMLAPMLTGAAHA